MPFRRWSSFSALLLSLGLPHLAGATAFSVTNLVTDDQTAHPAQITDANLVNPWGVSYGPTTPFWVSNNGSGTSTLYSVAPATNVTGKANLDVTIPGAGNVTGQAFNGSGSQFGGDNFLFVSEDGTISGWRGALGSNAEILQTASPSNVYKGAALGSAGGNEYLYAANFATGAIDILKGAPGNPNLTSHFTDPNLPSGYAPFNIANLGGTLYVAYAVQGTGGDEQSGVGNGIVDAFDVQGQLLGRIATGGALNSPWGLAIAPSTFGAFAGALLVGNFGDGTIHAYDPVTHAALGALTDSNGDPLAIDGLWALIPGNGGNGGSTGSIYFSAGPDGETHGLFGVISALPEPGEPVLLVSALAALAWVRRRS